MCGVIGMIGNDLVCNRLFTAANRLQNRGEHSTGIATYNGEFFYSHKGLGYASLAFHDYDISQLQGNSGIAHTRYATTGGDHTEKLMRNSQPVYCNRPGMFLCANGDMLNIVENTNKLKTLGFSFQSEVDAKIMQDIMVNILIKNKLHKAQNKKEYVSILFNSIKELHNEVNGAYSVLCLFEEGLLAFKDPHGIRPLCFAKKTNDNGDVVQYAFSSESTVFNYFGDYEDIYELEPCEAIFIENDTLNIHRMKLAQKQEAFCFFEFIYFSRPDTNYKGNVVEVVRKRLGQVLAEENSHMKDKCDVVVGVPGTGISAAHMFAEYLGLPNENAIIKVGNKRSFQESSKQKRQQAIDEKFVFIKEFVKGKRIALIDDSNVRGTTGLKIAKRLYNLGAKEVHYLFFCPPIIGPCYYGIDTPDENELIAYNVSLEEITKLMKVDSVTYISHKGLIRGLEIPENELCLACITRKYPTECTAELLERVSLRQKERAC